MRHPKVMLERHLRLAVKKIIAVRVHHHRVPEQHFDLRLAFKAPRHGG